MFQSLRPNSQLYIFHKGNEPKLEIGYVVNQPIMKPKYPVPPTIGQAQENVVDIAVKVNNITSNYNSLPAHLDIADCFYNGENVVISTSKEAMNSEISSLKQKSIDIVNSVDSHKKFIIEYDKILSDLNPEYAEKKQQQDEINSLKEQMNTMSLNMKELMDINRKLIEQFKPKENYE